MMDAGFLERRREIDERLKADPVLNREVLHDIVATGRWVGSNPAEALLQEQEPGDSRKVTTLELMQAIAERGVKCRYLGGDKRAPRCWHEKDCDRSLPCLLSVDNLLMS